MKSSMLWRGMITSVAVIGLSGAPAPAQETPADAPAQETTEVAEPARAADVQKGGDQAASEKEKEQKLELQVFQLKHAKPQEMIRLLQMHSGVAAGLPQFGGSGFGPRYGTTFGYRGQPAQNRPGLRVAADEEKAMLFVRGPEEQVQEVSRLVKAFDAPADEMTEGEQVEGRFVVPLRRADPQQATSILQQLQFTCQTLEIGETTLLVINAEGEDLKQAQEVIARLDGPPEGEAAEEASETSEAAAESIEERSKADAEAPDVDPVPPKAGKPEPSAEQDETE